MGGVQGIVGTTPWNAMVFFTLWLQLLGFSDLVSSTLMATFACGCALGAFAGGFIGAPSHPPRAEHSRCWEPAGIDTPLQRVYEIEIMEASSETTAT